MTSRATCRAVKARGEFVSLGSDRPGQLGSKSCSRNCSRVRNCRGHEGVRPVTCLPVARPTVNSTMAGPGMHQTQNLSLQQVLAPQLQQSLLILQAPLLELRNLVQQEMETNPVLEELATEPNADGVEEPATPTKADEEFKAEFDQLAKLDDEWRDYMAQSGSYSARSQDEEE